MKIINWIRPLENGSIEILGIKIGMSNEFAKYSTFRNLKEGKDCYYLENVMYEETKYCNVTFQVKHSKISGFSIHRSFYNQAEAETFYQLIYNSIHNKQLYNEHKEINQSGSDNVNYKKLINCKFTNNILDCQLFIQHGITNDNNVFYVLFSVTSIFSKIENEEKLSEALITSLCKMYVNSGYYMKNKRLHINYYNVFKALVVIIAFVLFYLFILNGRYYVSDQGRRITDKWTRTIYKCESVR